MSEPIIEIIVAAHNAQKTLPLCLQSLLATAYPAKKITVVDDGSTDQTAEIVRQTPGVNLLSQPQGGVSSARNLAWRQSAASWLATTDADCQVDPQWLTWAAAQLVKPGVGAVTGWLHYRVTNAVSALREAEYAGRYAKRRSQAQTLSAPVAVYSKAALQAVGGFDEAYQVGGEDTDLGYKLREAGYQIIFEPQMIVYHAAEDSLKMYLKRNYRNGKNFVRLWLVRDRQLTGQDDFRPWALKLQPVFTAALVLGIILSFWQPLGGLFLIIIGSGGVFWFSAPLIKQAAQLVGPSSYLTNAGVVLLRNLVWLAAAVAGLQFLWQKGKIKK